MLDPTMTDELTGLLNRQGLLFLGQYAISGANRRAEPLSLVFIHLDGIAQIDDSFGREQVDRALVIFSEMMRTSFRETDLVARQSDDKFVLLFNATNEEGAFIAMQHLQGKVTDFNQQVDNPRTLAFNWDCIEYNPARHTGLEDVLAEGASAKSSRSEGQTKGFERL